MISAPGEHTLKLIASSQDGRENFQEAKSLNLTGDAAEHDFDFVFPEGVKQYKAGTKVLQPKNDKVYECKPFPFSGWSDFAGAGTLKPSRKVWPSQRKM